MKVKVELEYEFDSIYESEEDVEEWIKYDLGLEETLHDSNHIYSSKIDYKITDFNCEIEEKP